MACVVHQCFRRYQVKTVFFLLYFWAWKMTFDVAHSATGNVSERKDKKTREQRKEAGKKKSLIHSCRCVTLLLPHQRFTTELMTKGPAPCSLLWPGEQYEGCEWLIPLDRWQVGPLSNLGTHFSSGLGHSLTGMGKPGLLTAAEPSPRALTESHCEGENIISIVMLWPSL